jgi:hypothetical protein
VIPRLGLRAIEAFVLLFAVLGFAFVPLGRRTALEHVQAVLSTPAATDARQELGGAVVRTLDRIRQVWQSPASSKDPPQQRVAPIGVELLPPPPRGAHDAGPPDVSL